MKNKRILSALLALLTVASLMTLAACSTEAVDSTSDTTTADDTAAVTVGETTTSRDPSGVPDDLDLSGEAVTFWYSTVASAASESFVDLNPELTGETLDDTIYNMNREIEQDLGVTLSFYDSGIESSKSGSEARKLMLADDTSYDAFLLLQWTSATNASEGIYYNMKDAPYISFDKPWWNIEYMEEMVIGDDSLFGLVGDFTVDRTRTLDCIYYNKDMYNDFYSDPNGLYQKVIDGEWTVEMYREICATVYEDLDGDSAISRGDRIGSTVNDYNNIDNFFYGFDIDVTERDSDGVPSFCINTDRTVNAIEKLYALVFETEGMFMSGNSYEADVANRDMFAAGQSMLLPGFFYTSEAMRDMKSDFGIIPMPKLDEVQDDYVSIVHDIMRIMYLPANSQKVESVSAVLEEMAYRSYFDVLPAYYDVLLKNKYVRDDVSAEMLDIIRDNCKPEFAQIYCFNNIGYVGRRLIQGKSTDFASYYASNITAEEKKLAELVEIYMG